MLLSGIGKPYNPATGDGVVGRNYAYQIGSGATVFFDEKTWMNPFMGAGALAINIDDFNTGSFDHAKEGFIGGGGISTPSAGGRPIGFRPVPPGTPAWGTEWKRWCAITAIPWRLTTRAASWPIARTISISTRPIGIVTGDQSCA
jgi:gluconate 2-dehydrogenase alpha chain